LTSGKTLARPNGDDGANAAAVTAMVVVTHGGRSVSTEPTTAFQPAVLRMVPVARAIRHALRGSGALVVRPRFLLRGWNGEQASAVADLSRFLDRIGGRYGPVPIVVVGHSMGARAALRAAGYPAVTAVAALAPWLPPGEPIEQLARPAGQQEPQRRVLLVHGTADRVTRPDDTWEYAERARSVADVAAVEIRNGDHAMLRRPDLWHDLAAEFTRMALHLPVPASPVAAAVSRTSADPLRTVL
jgi:alpha-beta hydrolase superfamily lysophospholipase